MNFPANMARVMVTAGAGFLFAAAPGIRAQTSVVNRANNFCTIEYYGGTNQVQMKTRLSGAEALPQPGGLLIIKQLKLESFYPNGKPETVVTAPECLYDPMGGTATSAGPLHLQTGDGKFRVEGEGFLWRQTNSFLTISNRVRSTGENGAVISTKP